MEESSPVVVITSAKNLDSIDASQQPLTNLEFQLAPRTHEEFAHFLDALTNNTHLFQHVTTLALQADILWTSTAAKELIEWIGVLPNLRSVSWTSAPAFFDKARMPLPLLTILLTRAHVQSLTLNGLQFISTPLGGMPGHTDVFQLLPAVLKELPALKLFRCIHCSISVPTELSWVPGEASKALMKVFVDEIVAALAFVSTIECIDIREESHGDTTPGRALLGLCKNGNLATAALQRLLETLEGQEPYPKVRLWIAHAYQPKGSNQFLKDVGQALARNTVVQDFRVRGNPERFVTSNVMDAYKELLEENVSLTTCDLMTKQGDQIDFYCRLNGMGRGELRQRLQQMTTKDQWVEEILVRFANDLDALFYWNQLHPVFLT